MLNSMKGIALSSTNPDAAETILHAIRRDSDIYEKSMIQDIENSTKKTETAVPISSVRPGM